MKQTNDGGPAFPTLDGRDGPNGPEYFSHDGLSKREWFAASSAAAEYANNALNQWFKDAAKRLFDEGYTQAQLYTYLCYQYADAMLAQRAEGE